jgi:sphingolipid delta-4 desaturase
MPMEMEFLHSTSDEPHGDRTRAIIAQHPEIRELFGRNPYTIFCILGLFAAQLTVSALLRDASIWWIVGVAYLFGAVATHGLAVMIHEADHNLLFRRKKWNSVAAIIANLPLLVPSAVSFQRYHLKHHAYQGIHDLDADLPSRWETVLVGNGTIRKAIWLFFFPVVLALRPAHLKGIPPFCRWTVGNIIVAFAFDAAVWIWLGPNAFMYLFLSMWFALGLHPMGARWIQEHFVFNPPQETYSYYGVMNYFVFNIGYHNEHHDFPSVPWNKIRRVRQIAPEWYDTLTYHKSWTKLMLRFIFDRRISLFSRVDRPASIARTAQPQRQPA